MGYENLRRGLCTFLFTYGLSPGCFKILETPLVCLRLATIKGHSETCSFALLGRSGGVRKPVSIWCDHHLPHAVQHISFALS